MKPAPPPVVRPPPDNCQWGGEYSCSFLRKDGYLHRPTHFVRLRFDIPRVLRPWNVKCHVKTKRWYTMLRFKCWYYDQAIQDGSEDWIKSLLPDHLPDDIQPLYDHAHQ